MPCEKDNYGINPAQNIRPHVGRNPKLKHRYTLPTGVKSLVKKRDFQKKLSGALEKKPKKVTVWKNYVEFEYAPKSKFGKFRYMRVGNRGTLLNIACPKGKWSKGKCKVGMQLHHVLVPTKRVLDVASKWPSISEKTKKRIKKKKKSAANKSKKNPLLMTVYGNPPYEVVHTYNDVRDTHDSAMRFSAILAVDRGVRSEIKEIDGGHIVIDEYGKAVEFLRNDQQAFNPDPGRYYHGPYVPHIPTPHPPRLKYATNPATTKSKAAKAAPFRKGSKVPLKKFEKWLYANATPEEISRYESQKRNYQKAHLGTTPKHVIREVIDVGISREVTDRDFVYDMGESPEEWYTVPQRSGKAAEALNWVHKWEKHPRTLVTADGKALIKPLRGSAKVKSGWMHG